jgi:hypothetical protein
MFKSKIIRILSRMIKVLSGYILTCYECEKINCAGCTIMGKVEAIGDVLSDE